MNIKTWRNLLVIIAFFFLSNHLLAQDNIIPAPKQNVDSSLWHSAIDLTTCIQNQKKMLGREVVLKGFCLGSTEIATEKDGSFFVLVLDDAFPNNKISVVITDTNADLLGFSRYQYHQKQLIVKGKLEKSKKFKDEFGNPRLVINIKQLEQISY